MKKLFQHIRNWFIKPLPEGRNYHMQDYKYWGSCIQWTKWPKLQVHGFLYRKPVVGDTLTCEFSSGEIHKFQFIRIERCRDPNDMFFADLKYLRTEPK